MSVGFRGAHFRTGFHVHIPACYTTTRIQDYWVSGYYDSLWIEPVMEKRWIRGHFDDSEFWVPGHYETVVIRDGYYRQRWNSGHWSYRTQRALVCSY